jgi:hypothetical protein
MVSVSLPAGSYDYAELKTALDATDLLTSSFRQPGLDVLLASLRSGAGTAAALNLVNTQIVRPTSTAIAAVTTAGNWTVASNVTLQTKAFPTPAPSGRTNGLSITKPTTGTFGGARAVAVTPFRLSNAEVVRLWLYWGADQGSVSVRFTSGDFTARREFSWAYSGQLHKGWNLLTIRPDDDGTTAPGGAAWVVTGTQPLTDLITGVQINVSANSGNSAEIYLDGIDYQRKIPIKGSVSFGFDRFGEASIPNLMLPIFQECGIAGYWAGDGNLINGATSARGMLETVYAAGWDAISQGMNHPDYTAAGAAQLGTDYDTAKAIFQAGGFTNALDLFAYPLSANDASTDAMLVSKGVRMARSGWAWAVHPNEFNAGPKLIGHGAVNMGGKTLTTIKKLIDSAARYKTRLDLFTHGGVTGGDGTAPPADPLMYYTNDERSAILHALSYEASGDLEVEKPTRYLDRYILGR